MATGIEPIELLSPARVAALLGVSKQSLWRLRQQDSTFPRPIRVTERRIGFRKSDLQAWLLSRGVAR